MCGLRSSWAWQRSASHEAPATVLNSLMEITGAGGALGIPGLYVTGDPGGIDANAKVGNLSIRIGLGWAKSHVLTMGQCPVMKYNRQLMNAILFGKIKTAKTNECHRTSSWTKRLKATRTSTKVLGRRTSLTRTGWCQRTKELLHAFGRIWESSLWAATTGCVT